jgi:hypothetical protein
MNSHEGETTELFTPELLTPDLDMLEDEEQDNEMQKLLASMLTSMDGVKEGSGVKEGGVNNMQHLLSSMISSMQESNNQEGGVNNMQHLLSSMISSMQRTNNHEEGNNHEECNNQEEGNINDLFSKLLGNIKNTEETLDDDYILSEDQEEGGNEDQEEGGNEDQEEGGNAVQEEGGEILSEDDFKEMITSFNEANMMNNFKVMFEMLSKKMPHPKEDDSIVSNMEDVD